jgi:hypothetical protein
MLWSVQRFLSIKGYCSGFISINSQPLVEITFGALKDLQYVGSVLKVKATIELHVTSNWINIFAFHIILSMEQLPICLKCH